MALTSLVQNKISDELFDHETVELAEFIDKMYSYFESRSCLDCEYFQNQISDSEISCDLICGFFNMGLLKYCGAFKLKETK